MVVVVVAGVVVVVVFVLGCRCGCCRVVVSWEVDPSARWLNLRYPGKGLVGDRFSTHNNGNTRSDGASIG